MIDTSSDEWLAVVGGAWGRVLGTSSIDPATVRAMLVVQDLLVETHAALEALHRREQQLGTT